MVQFDSKLSLTIFVYYWERWWMPIPSFNRSGLHVMSELSIPDRLTQINCMLTRAYTARLHWPQGNSTPLDLNFCSSLFLLYVAHLKQYEVQAVEERGEHDNSRKLCRCYRCNSSLATGWEGIWTTIRRRFARWDEIMWYRHPDRRSVVYLDRCGDGDSFSIPHINITVLGRICVCFVYIVSHWDSQIPSMCVPRQYKHLSWHNKEWNRTVHNERLGELAHWSQSVSRLHVHW